MQVSWKDCNRLIPQIDFEFLCTEQFDQSLDFSREPLGHVIGCVRKLGLIQFQQIAKPLVQHFDWMYCCHDYLPRFESADRLSKGAKFEFYELGGKSFREKVPRVRC